MATSSSDIQRRFMYIFERVGEPLYFGPRGTDSLFYDVPTDQLCEKTRDASVQLRRTMGPGAGGGSNNVTIRRPRDVPNLTRIASVCPKNSIFTSFLPSHRRAASELRNILNSQQSTEDLLNMACYCRDSPMVNAQLFVNAMAGCILSRPDLKGFRMPPLWEILPDQFVSSSVIQQALTLARLPNEDRMIIMLNRDTTGRDNNPENRLWYYREDIGANSHHWHWHIVYPFDAPANVVRDRRGELFYYMHHEMVARYESERLGNGLSRTTPFAFDQPITEGYFSKLFSTNAGRHWGNRQEKTKLQDVDRTDLDSQGVPEVTRVTLEEVKKWRDRILEAIDTGMVLVRNTSTGEESRRRLTPFEGIDILGDIVENSSNTVNLQFYGSFHNQGHNIIAFSHDPQKKHQENSGPMGDSSTAMRDPVFYRWHKYIDNIFDQWKRSLQPYPRTGFNKTEYPLQWEGITVSSVSVQTANQKMPNTLSTFWMQSDINLARGLDFGRTTANTLGPIWARFTHLNHDDFTYNIQVQNTNVSPLLATVRIYMAPRLDEHQDRFSMQVQRLLFFELDKFTITLAPGQNTIQRSSLDSNVAIGWENTFAALEQASRASEPTAGQGICGCGWPQHLLIPRGSPQGMLFDLVVFVTNGEDDKVQAGSTNGSNTSSTEARTCRDAMSYCGILDQRYPDSKPMGYPWDRNPYTIVNPNDRNAPQIPTRNLDEFVQGISNMATTQVRIIHNATRTVVRQGGAPANMELITEQGVCMPQTQGNQNPSNRRPPQPQPIPNMTPIMRPTFPVTNPIARPSLNKPSTPISPQSPQQGQTYRAVTTSSTANRGTWNPRGHQHQTGAGGRNKENHNHGGSRVGDDDSSSPGEEDWDHVDHAHESYYDYHQ